MSIDLFYLQSAFDKASVQVDKLSVTLIEKVYGERGIKKLLERIHCTASVFFQNKISVEIGRELAPYTKVQFISAFHGLNKVDIPLNKPIELIYYENSINKMKREKIIITNVIKNPIRLKSVQYTLNSGGDQIIGLLDYYIFKYILCNETNEVVETIDLTVNGIPSLAAE